MQTEDLSVGQLAAECGTDKYEHGYGPAYEAILAPLRHEPLRLLEVGVWEGASLRLWDRYFDHPAARIDGVDVAPRCDGVGTRVAIFLTDVKRFTPVLPYDVIIDDGSHIAADIVAALARLWPSLIPGGWYVIEDLRTQWQSEYGGFSEVGSPATDQLWPMLESLWREDATRVISEMRCWPQLVAMRKAALA